MQRTQVKISGDAVASEGKRVTVCIQSTLYVLHGNWDWDMQSEAVYCSDVIYFPANFEGTTGIIHPDDIDRLANALGVSKNGVPLNLAFRIFTTYGQIKKITGRRLFVHTDKTDATDMPPAAPWENAVQAIASRRETEHLQLLKEVTDAAEKQHDTGTWFINKTTREVYYSDNVFRIHGLPPQSLNAHPHTFQSLIHPDDRLVVSETLEKAYAQELPVQLEYRIIKPKGDVRHLQVITQWVYSKKGQLILRGVVKDITAQREEEMERLALQDLLGVQRQLAQYTEQFTGAGFWYMNLTSRKVTFSDNYFRLFGLKQTPEATTHQKLLEMVHPEDAALVQENLEKLYRGQPAPEFDFRIIRPDGSIRQLRQLGKVILSPAAEKVALAILADVTNLKGLESNVRTQEEQLERYRKRFGLTEDAAHLGTIIWNAPGESMLWSDGLYILLGYKPHTVKPEWQLFQKAIQPNDLHTFQQQVDHALAGQAVADLNFRISVKGSIRYISLTFRHINLTDQNVLLCLVQDVTEPLLLHQQLDDERRFTQLVGATLPEGMILTDANNAILKWNSTMEGKTGLKKSDVLYENLLDVLPALKEPALLNDLQAALNGEQKTGIKKNSGYFSKIHQYTLAPCKNEIGGVAGVLHLVRDVSKERELEERLHERLNFIESLVESSVDRIIVLDRNMNYLYWNHRAEAYYGIKKDEVLGRNILEIFPGFRDDPSHKEFRKALHGEIVHIAAAQNLKAKKGYFETYLIPIKNNEQAVSGVLWIVHDLLNEYLIQQQQQKAVDILNMVNAVFVELDDEHRITYINPTAEAYLNKTRDALLGKVLWEVFPQSINTKAYDAILKASTERVKVDVEYFSEVYNKWIFMSVSPADTGVILLQYDRQHVKEAEEKLEKSFHWMQQTAQTSPDAIFIFDRTAKKSTFLNHCMAEWLGADPDTLAEIVQADPYALIHPEDHSVVERFNEQLETTPDGVVLTLEYRIQYKTSPVLWIHNRSRIFERAANGQVTHVLSILQNITEEKAVDAELKNLHTSLEKISHELESRNEEITSFAYIASHDLREPLRKIQTFGNWLLDREESNLSASGKEYLSKMSTAAKRMGEMIDAILMLSRTMTAEASFTMVDLNDVLQAATTALHQTIRETSATIEMDSLPMVAGDASQLTQLFTHLLSNALRFHLAGNKPHIRITGETASGSSIPATEVHAQTRAKYVAVSISDNGIGFEQKYASQIFQIFHRLHGRHEFPGSGMGLAICKKIMENHKGYMTAAGKAGAGATFTCYFPVR